VSFSAHVALVGCGFAGTSAFFQLVDRYPVREITVFERSGRFGPGYPYHPDECRDYLINNTNDTMCLVPSNRRAFVEWLRGRPDLAPDLDEKGHVPRAVFGRFLEDAFAAARTTAAVKGIKVNLVPAEATAMREDAQGRVRVGWKGGETTADVAILTTGRCPDLDAFETPPQGAAARYVANHIGSDALDGIPLDATVHVLGASLSAYDVVNRLFSPETGCRFAKGTDGAVEFLPGPNQRRVVLCSRSGRLKKAQSRTPMALDRRHFTLKGLREAAAKRDLTLEDVADLIRREAEDHSANVDWRAAVDPYGSCKDGAAVNARAGELLEADIDAARAAGPENFLVDFFADAQTTLWDGFAEALLAPEEEKLYRARVETAVLSYAAPCPVSTAERLLALHRAGRLSVIRGVRDVSLAPDGTHYAIAHPLAEERAEVLINATGSVDRRVTSAGQPPLVRNLVASGLLAPYTRGGEEMVGAAVDMESFRAGGARNIYVANMLLWGPGFFTSSAFMMATIVERLLEAVFPTAATSAPSSAKKN
jgi:hypothetical protein